MKKNVLKIGLNLFLINLIALVFLSSGFAQNKRITLGILNIDSQGFSLSANQMGNLVRIEAEKLDTFEVIDRYDVAYLIDKHDLVVDNCFGKICLVETGKIINAQKMLSGSVEMYGQTTIITLRLVDVESATTERTHVREFLNLPNELQQMIRITMREMFELPVNEEMVTRLTKRYNYENAVNNPNKVRLSLAGPRMGGSYIIGESANILALPEHEGGYDAFPLMFQFGYQIEVQYLTHGTFQALFEFIPNVTGLGQGLFFPSLTLLQGLRHTKYGFEFAFGPTVGITKLGTGYYLDNQWYLKDEWADDIPNPNPIVTRMDSRGDYALSPGFMLGLGKTFKSGNLNIPINAYVVLRKSSLQFGLSLGFNAKKDK